MNKQEIKKKLSGLRKIYPYLKNETSKERMRQKAKELKQKLNSNIQSSHDHAQEIFAS